MDIDRIDEATVGGLIGAHPLAVRWEKMVERVYASSIGANSLCKLAIIVECREVPCPAVAFRFQRIEVSGQSEKLGFVFQLICQIVSSYRILLCLARLFRIETVPRDICIRIINAHRGEKGAFCLQRNIGL